MSQAGLQCGFGTELGIETLSAIAAQGFTIVRIDVQDCDNAQTLALTEEVLNVGLQPLCIIRRVEQMENLPLNALVEIGNEPDLKKFGWTPQSYKMEAQKCVNFANSSGHRLYVGAVSNLIYGGRWWGQKRGFDFLKTLPWNQWPENICCSFHRYPEGMEAKTPHKGSKSRNEEMNTLREIVGSRPIACTEVGYFDTKWTPDEVAQNMQWERRFFAQQGCDFVIGFQINDGEKEDPSSEAHYGFRASNGEWKSVTTSFVGALSNG